MFFDGSMRSVRAMTSRSPTASASAAAAARAAGDAATSSSAATSGPRLAANGAGSRRAGPSTRARRRRYASAQRCVWKPAGPDASAAHSSAPTSVGQDGEVVGTGERRVREVHDAQVGPLRAQLPGDERELVVLHEHDVAVACALCATASAKRWFTATNASHASRKRRSNRGRRARSNMPWCRNHSTPFATTS